MTLMSCITVLPWHCTAEGKVLLAFPRPDLAGSAVPSPSAARTGRTIISQAAWESEIQMVRVRGYALDDEECEPGLRSLAAPIFGDGGWATAAIGIAGPGATVTVSPRGRRSEPPSPKLFFLTPSLPWSRPCRVF